MMNTKSNYEIVYDQLCMCCPNAKRCHKECIECDNFIEQLERLDKEQEQYESQPTICNVCGGKVILLYTGLKHSTSGYIYKCTNCGASVSTSYKDKTKAMGTLATMETKKKRRECHTWFDKLWEKHNDREKWYLKLSKELGIPREKCHFGTMSDSQLDRSLEIIKKWWLEKYDK